MTYNRWQVVFRIDTCVLLGCDWYAIVFVVLAVSQDTEKLTETKFFVVQCWLELERVPQVQVGRSGLLVHQSLKYLKKNILSNDPPPSVAAPATAKIYQRRRKGSFTRSTSPPKWNA